MLNLGIDQDGITEMHHYHKDHDYKGKFTVNDKFFRETFKPMYLMKFTLFNKILTEAVNKVAQG